jgi:hypothetical protein
MKYEEWLAHFNEKHDNKGRFAKKAVLRPPPQKRR